MLRFEWRRDRNVLVITPDGPLSKSDFEQFTREIDPLMSSNGKLAGLLIFTRSFPGWQDFGAFVSHLKFIRRHHRYIARIAAVTDSKPLKVLSYFAGFFVHPEIKHFGSEEKDQALTWLETNQ